MTALIDRLIAARDSGKAVADAEIELPATLAEAYAVQDAYVQRLLARNGGRHLGYKLGATNDAILAAMGLERPFAGPIVSDWVHQGSTTLARSDFFLCVIEAEIGFRLGCDLPGDASRYSLANITDAIAEAFPVIEVADSRLQNWQKPDARAIVSDLGAAGAIIVGQPFDEWRSVDLSGMPVTLTAEGVAVAVGSGAMALGNPVACLLAFARERAEMGRPLRAGEIVSSGTCTPPYPGKPGQHLIANFGPFGQLELTLT